jgi:hypothetical protein
MNNHWMEPWFDQLSKLMQEWDKLTDGDECHGPFVSLFDNMNCVDQYGEKNNNGRWDEMKIEFAVRQACEAREVDYRLSKEDKYVATVGSHTYESECSAVAILRSYLSFLKEDQK